MTKRSRLQQPRDQFKAPTSPMATPTRGHMGYTFRFIAEGVDAVEREFGYGRAPALSRTSAGRRADDPGLPRLRHFAQKTGYKIFDRYKEHGLEALSDRSRRPVRLANQLPVQLEARIVAVKREAALGARKIRE
jgi:Homeodomain-like domain